MLKPIPLLNLLDQAKETSIASNPTNFKLSGVIITPESDIEVTKINGVLITSDFYSGRSHSDNYFLDILISPGIYQKYIAPFKDDLIIEYIESFGIKRNLKRLRLVPLVETDPTVSGSSSIMSDLSALDNSNLVVVQFQAFDLGYEKIRNININTNYLAAKVEDAIHYTVSNEIKQLELNGVNALKGVDIEEPVDNVKIYRSMNIPANVMLVDLANYLQKADGFGVYTRGLGSYYKNNTWFVYPLCKEQRYGKVGWSLDILKFPQDATPTIEQSYFVSNTGNHVTILTTGEAEHSDNSDIDFQNYGQGKRLISDDVVAGNAGIYKNNGRIIKTRKDSVTEYKTNNRKSKVNRVVIDGKPTSNIYREISQSVFNAGDLLMIDWHNSNPDLLYPGMPLRYYYMVGNILKMREGTLFSVNTNFQSITNEFSPTFKKISKLMIFLNPLEDDIEE